MNLCCETQEKQPNQTKSTTLCYAAFLLKCSNVSVFRFDGRKVERFGHCRQQESAIAELLRRAREIKHLIYHTTCSLTHF